MAVNPKLIALALKVITTEKGREKLIIGIVMLVVFLIFFIALPIYILTEPLETFKSFLFEDNKLSIIENIKLENGYSSQNGITTFFGTFPIPIESQYGYTVSSEYGYRTHPITKIYKLHTGIDIVGKIHGNILSIADGEVVWAGLRGAYGNCINIKHTSSDGTEFYSFYAHLARIDVAKNQIVTQGQVIGIQGGAKTDPGHGSSTGSHLHLEIRLSPNGNFQNPREYIGNI